MCAMWSTPLSCERVDLFTDLDNTLIYSRRRPLPGDKVVVERLNGADQSFMTGRTLEFFQHAPWVRVIPVTTRSVSQFERIAAPGLKIPSALVCNGGVLLMEGVPDVQWLEETRQLAGRELATLPRARAALERLASPEHVHMPEGLMVYAKWEDAGRAARLLREQTDGTLLDVLHGGGKVYAIPRSLNKGMAVKRFKRRFITGFTVAAGDSEFDIPLLNAADLAVFPPALEGAVRAPRTVVVREGPLSDGLCDVLESLRSK